MKPLEAFRDQTLVLSGLGHRNGAALGDGPGDHARAAASYLTGVHPRKTAGADIQNGISVDQVAAQEVGKHTRFGSLELGCDDSRTIGNCDSGYSCAYTNSLAWRGPATPMPPETNPRLVFERLFGSGSHGQRQANLKRRRVEQKSILDFVLDDARSMQGRLNSHDQSKLDQYLTSVREVETRLEKEERFGQVQDPTVETPPGIPADYAEYVQLMYDMVVLAFQTDSTRVATLLLAHDGSNRSFDHIGISEGHHDLTHHQNRPEWIEKVSDIDLWYVQQFAKFLDKLQATKDADGHSLLENSMIVYGSGNADGNRHTHSNLPVIVAGKGGGTMAPGRFVKHGSKPMSNLFLSMADRMGLHDLKRFGDSTDRLGNI
jgi:hypothetical protein